MERLVFITTLFLCLTSFVSAQKRSDILENYDLDSTTEIFCDTVTFAVTPPSGMDTCASGTAAEDGWIDARTEDFKGVTIHIDVMALTSGTIDVAIYGRVKVGTTAIQLGTTQAYAAAATQYIVVPEAIRQIRVGIIINGVDDGDAADEDISLYYYGSRRIR